MERFDFSPLFRSTIGFDRLTRLVDAATRVDNTAVAYPPYNIEKEPGEDAYRLTMAVAGFSSSKINITVQRNAELLVTEHKTTITAATICTAALPSARFGGVSAWLTT